MQSVTRRAALAGVLGIGGLMTLSGDDELDDLFVPAPAGQAQPMSYRQGTIISFDPNTLLSRVRIGGSGGPEFHDLPVLGVAEAAGYAPGDVVGIMCAGETMAVMGEYVIPNTQKAFDALAYLSSRTFIDSTAAVETTTSSSFVDLSTIGPKVTVDIPRSGRILLTLGGYMAAYSFTLGDSAIASMSVDIAGANTIAPGPPNTVTLGHSFGVGVNQSHTTFGKHVFTRLVTGLNPGITTFTAKYRQSGSTAAGETAEFGERIVIVQLL